MRPRLIKWSSLRTGDSSGPPARGPSPHPSSLPLDSGKPRDSKAKEETRDRAAAGDANTQAASGNSRVTPRRRRAPRGEAVADRWRLRTGSAHCAPLLPNRPPARRPFGASVGESPVVGAEPVAVPAASSSSPYPSPPSHTPFPIPAPSPSRPPTFRTRMPCPEQPSSA